MILNYSQFILVLLCPPLAALLFILRRKLTRLTWLGLLGLVLIAVAYTTPWDNYLVATRVWFYNPSLVLGIILGYVPLEEYVFFIVQTLAVGLFAVWLWRWLYPQDWTPVGRTKQKKK